jgi:hypothetical protein
MRAVTPYRFPNGRSKYRRPGDFDPAALRQGMGVEAEHSTDPRVQLRIAMDHLTEDPAYYRKLRRANLGQYADEDCALTPKSVRAAGGALLGGGLGFAAAYLAAQFVPVSATNPLEAFKLKGVLYVGLSVLGAIAGSTSLAEQPTCPWD